MPVTLRDRVIKASAKTRRRKTQASPFFTTPNVEHSNLQPGRTDTNRAANIPQPPGLPFSLQPAKYGLIQERICVNLYALVVQAILWNQTRGQAARPVLFRVLATYPTPNDLAKASRERLTEILQPIGLHNIRASRLIALAEVWLAAPPCKERRYRKLHYPSRGCGTTVKPGEILGPEDEREGWEIAHLPGMGAYALDSYRIFHRDRLRGLETTDNFEPEWKRVIPTDKELKPYLAWRWTEQLNCSGNELI
jgi:methyl-CpG-binding domain protein 4